jgi:hypothetical protein
MLVLDDVHGFADAEIPDPANIVVPPMQVVKVPDMIGKAWIVTVDETEHPNELV